jgi:hypothetical protein
LVPDQIGLAQQPGTKTYGVFALNRAQAVVRGFDRANLFAAQLDGVPAVKKRQSD